MPQANEYQIGGKHYKSSYEHWDMVLATRMGYLEGNATRYITRWRSKDGTKDLDKALHYIDKLIEWAEKGHDRTDVSAYWLADVKREIIEFALANKLSQAETDVIIAVGTWTRVSDLLEAKQLLLDMPLDTNPAPVPLEDSNKHAPRVGDPYES